MNVPGIARAVALLGVAACGSTGTDVRNDLNNQLRAREAAWAENGSASYSVRIERLCECPNVYDVRLQVADSVAVSGEHVFSGDALTEAELAAQLTLPDLFEVVRDALNRRVPHISVSYHPDFGFVQYLFIDYDFTKSDDDVEFIVGEYAPAGS